MLLSSLLVAFPLWAVTHLSLLEEGSHCVAYKATKRMFLVSHDDVIGKNCDIVARVLPEVGGLYHIEVTIPIAKFDSANKSRDEDVAKDMKVDVRPELTFKSKSLTADAWRTLFAKGEFDLEGELSIGDKGYPLKVKSTYVQTDADAEVDGVARVKYADFGLETPSAGGGLVAKASPELELHFHLLGSRILGADSIRLEKEKTK